MVMVAVLSSTAAKRKTLSITLVAFSPKAPPRFGSTEISPTNLPSTVKFHNFTGLIGIDIEFVAVTDEQVAVGSQRHSQRSMQVNLICVDNKAFPVGTVDSESVPHRKNSVISGGRDVKNPGLGIIN
jgi:hypothetical protein